MSLPCVCFDSYIFLFREDSWSFSNTIFIFSYILVLNEIEERKEWLQDMYRLGQGEQHRAKIASEIALRVSRLEQLHKKKCREEVRAKLTQKGKEKK
jgi:hypothetical protein